MAADTILRPLAAPGPSQRLVGHGRGNRTRVLLDLNDAIAPCLEGMALADEAAAFARRVHLAVQNDSLMVAAHAAGQLADRAARYRREFARMCADIDPDDVA